MFNTAAVELTQFERTEIAQKAREDYYSQLMATYQRKSATLSGRKVEFLKKDPSACTEAALLIGGGTLSGAVGGAVVGGILGGVCGSPGGPPGVVLGVAIGAPIGGIIGGIIGGGVAAAYLRPRYLEWCRTETGREFAGQLAIFLSEDKALEHLICPITQLPVIEGVRTPQGQLYEKSEIEAWLEVNESDPLTREPLTKNQLVLDEDASLESIKIFVAFLIDKREETREAAPSLMPGYNKLIADIRTSAMSIYNKKLAVLQKQYREERITYEDFTEQSRKLVEKYLNV